MPSEEIILNQGGKIAIFVTEEEKEWVEVGLTLYSAFVMNNVSVGSMEMRLKLAQEILGTWARVKGVK